MNNKKVGIGMMERDAEFVGPDDFPSLEAFWETLKPRPVDGSGRAAQAKALEDFLKARANWPWTGSASDLAFFFGTFPENSAESLAALWLSSYSRLNRLAEEMAGGKKDTEAVERLMREAETLGTLKERMFWRSGADQKTGVVREQLALSGRAYKEKSDEGAAKRRGQIADHTGAALAEMRRLVESGHTISRAARLSAKKGIGTSAGANRQLWTRHHKVATHP